MFPRMNPGSSIPLCNNLIVSPRFLEQEVFLDWGTGSRGIVAEVGIWDGPESTTKVRVGRKKEQWLVIFFPEQEGT